MIGKARTADRSAGITMLDRATRWPLYTESASEPFVVLLLTVGQPGARLRPGLLLVGLAVLHSSACFLLLRAGLAHHLGGPRPGRWLVALAVVLTAAGVALAAGQGGPDAGGGRFGLASGAAALLFCCILTGSGATLLPTGPLVAAVLLPAAGAGALQVLVGAADRPTWAVNYVLTVGFTALYYRFSVWFLGLLWELARSRDVQAQLAVAQERLRFARDLHDVLGRNLALIAVNSQLAAELARRGQDGAHERMLQVHRTAQDSMRELREVVAGSRTTDLASELAGARSVLRSAGIEARVIGDAAGLPAPMQVALGWVVREATTNIIRHSDPRTVRIDLEVGAAAQLRIENDGVSGDADEKPWGNGLVGLSERLVTLGGDLVARLEPDGRFLVQARLPLPALPSPDQQLPASS